MESMYKYQVVSTGSSRTGFNTDSLSAAKAQARAIAAKTGKARIYVWSKGRYKVHSDWKAA